ncbi:hypothetical protein HBI56_119700 [Parastagonospora nodorum]|uniref:Uncharacterized protein n=1 Tax=Phaeosphaeria nodorum (strain SN15 / ATCC MYA-4574 / FGSC 10173) TaxID=321614 RepID=A0A7U2FBS0_PHANO|nr:hypothetical protein HBH56_055060 [Parastagonospora nodorum]QRD02372.1 hypothetical protein JI435_417860 [Parastagonospora nodorum SN15]KAH3935526.1 hypothetical protein HBH54_040860 [Parastagonospora nodorum]KAH3948626.1 hypothetical protein HBH53_098440 [Parastagonospora nodorum]KAH3970113.1 hypothetical protein HBH51_121000 [Parastagonospora nodorum]
MRSCESLLCFTGFCSGLATILLHFKGVGLSIWAHRRIGRRGRDQRPLVLFQLIAAFRLLESQAYHIFNMYTIAYSAVFHPSPSPFFSAGTKDLNLHTVIIFERSQQHHVRCDYTTLNLVQLAVARPIYISFRSHRKLP